MKVICPSCVAYHDVIRTLDDGFGDVHTLVYEVAPLESCTRKWLSEKELLEATQRFGEEALITEAEGD